jgi:hypothetical protein
MAENDYRISSKIKSWISLCQYNIARLPYTSSANTLRRDFVIRRSSQAPRFDHELRCIQIIMRGLLSVGAYTAVIVGRLQNN